MSDDPPMNFLRRLRTAVRAGAGAFRHPPAESGVSDPEPEPEPVNAVAPRVSIDDRAPLGDGEIDVRALLETLTVEELIESADDYFRNIIGDGEYFRSKPFTQYAEAADEVTAFANVLLGVRPLRGMRVLDFGAGTGWSSRFLAHLGCEVVMCDVSRTALDFARQHFIDVPLTDSQPMPEFLWFDGEKIDLPDESVDRVTCIDAFHHTPNQDRVLHELGRVLKPGGIAGFQEPGPNHSKNAQSQFEMRNFTVIENDILMGEIWGHAQQAGFDACSLAVFSGHPFHVSIDDYEDFLSRGPTADRYLDHVHAFATGRRIFFLRKAGVEVTDSRDRGGLMATLDLSLHDLEATAVDGIVRGSCTVTNTGASTWLPSSVEEGGVRVGVHLYDADGNVIDREFGRIPLPGDDVVVPGQQVTTDFRLPSTLGSGAFVLQFDMVAEGVTWFELNGAETVRCRVDVD